MPITTEYNGELIVTRMTGLIALPDLLAYAEDLAALEARPPASPHRITYLANDFVAELDFVGLHTFAAKRRAAAMKNPVKSAVVAENAVQFGFARMFQTLNDNPSIRIEVFQSEAPALSWLRE